MSAVPCRFCGIATDPSTAETFHPIALPSDGQFTARERARKGEPLTVTLGTCPDCQAAIVDRATERLTPSLVAEFGNVAPDMLTNAYAALAVIGHHTEAAPRALIKRLGSETQTQWLYQFIPTQHLADGTACPERWGFVTREQRADIMAAYVAVVTPTRTYDCPTVGCGFCGVGTSTTWTPYSVGSQYLGGPVRPDRMNVYLCDACAHHVEDVGAVGPTAMERSLYAAKNVASGSWDGPPELVGLRGWAVTGRKEANATPWEHVVIHSPAR